MNPAAASLMAAYAGDLDSASAQEWVLARRAVLLARAAPSEPFGHAASSGCAASGARTHTLTLAEDAAHALARLDAGLAPVCEVCTATLPFERLDSAPAAVRCTGCARRDSFDTRWCR